MAVSRRSIIQASIASLGAAVAPINANLNPTATLNDAAIPGTTPSLADPVSTDAQLLALGAAVLTALAVEDRAWTAFSRGEDTPEAEALEESAWRASNAWDALAKEMAAIPAYGRQGLATKFALMIRVVRDGFPETTATLAESLRHDIGRIIPNLVELLPC